MKNESYFAEYLYSLSVLHPQAMGRIPPVSSLFSCTFWQLFGTSLKRWILHEMPTYISSEITRERLSMNTPIFAMDLPFYPETVLFASG